MTKTLAAITGETGGSLKGPIYHAKPYAGVDPDYGPKIPNGSVWERGGLAYMVQWLNGDGWLLLGWDYSPYMTDNTGGSRFIPCATKDGQYIFTEDELAALIAAKELRRIDLHYEPVEARR